MLARCLLCQAVQTLTCYNLEANAQEIDIPFSCDQSWTASLTFDDDADAWATVSPESGEAGDNLRVKVKLDENESLKNSRKVY